EFAMSDYLAAIRRFLTNSSLHATPEWVEGCVEFFISNHQNDRFSHDDLKKFVLEQWKLADLTEMGQGCLPPNLASITKTTLPGRYAVQVEWMKDVGQPAYRQLQNLQKKVNNNAEIGEKLPEAWEPKPTRMLQLSLNDGKQTILGMEYKSISSLNEELLPGFKVLIIGPVECRRGVVLLQEHNLQIIGGEVDSLLIPNATENVLARTLNLEQNADPYRTQTEQTSSIQVPAQTTAVQNVQPALINNVVPRITNQVACRNGREELFDENNFMIGDEDNARLSRLEHQFQEEYDNVHQIENDTDELEQKYLREIQNMNLDELEFDNVDDENVLTNPLPQTLQGTSERNDTSHLLDGDDDFLYDLPLDDLEKTSNELSRPESNITLSKLNSKLNPAQTESASAGKCKAKSLKSQNKQSKITSFLNKSSDNFDSGLGTPSTSSGKNTSVKTRTETIKKSSGNQSLCSEFETDIERDFETECDIIDWPDDDFETNEKDEIKDGNSQKTVNVVKPVITNPEPFVYLSQIKLPVERRKVYTVKAFVLTLVTQLTFGDDGWNLSVTICDGSGYLNVKLSSDVLEKLIGFSATEMRALRQDVSKNPLLKDKLKN
ncbi:hypothetical protein L9F63_014451, partial [Diploptera punctata]